jgi:hypothetical protein
MFKCEVYCWNQNGPLIEDWVHVHLPALTESEAIFDAKMTVKREHYEVREMKEYSQKVPPPGKYYCSFYCWNGTKDDWRAKKHKNAIRVWLYADSEKDAIQRAQALTKRGTCELQKMEVI